MMVFDIHNWRLIRHLCDRLFVSVCWLMTMSVVWWPYLALAVSSGESILGFSWLSLASHFPPQPEFSMDVCLHWVRACVHTNYRQSGFLGIFHRIGYVRCGQYGQCTLCDTGFRFGQIKWLRMSHPLPSTTTISNQTSVESSGGATDSNIVSRFTSVFSTTSQGKWSSICHRSL